jgi:predicted extracellular nuclease
MFTLDRFGEYTVSASGQQFQYTQTNAPDAAGYQAYLESVAANSIMLDDGLSTQNPNPIKIIDGGDGILTSGESFRMGDQLSDVTGVLTYSFNEFRIQNGTGTYRQTNPRPDQPADTGGNFKIASLNVLNYFTTLDLPSALTDNGSDPRGADTLAEFERQAEKIVNAIVAMDADILGLVELENDFAGTNIAIEDLVNRVNAALGGEIYAWIDPGQEFIGSDAIANGIIYKIAEVEPLGDAAILTTFDGRNFLDPLGAGNDLNRPAIAQTFEDLDTGQIMTVSVNHLKSKGSVSGIGADYDQLDGQSNNNATRTAAVDILADWLASDPTGQGSENTLILGDLNAYAMEDPITALQALGYTNLSSAASGGPGTPYTYVFDGQVGTLDYILALGPMVENLTGVTEWHINADEADAFDYNMDFGRDPSLFDGASAARNSDHDPVIAGFNLPIYYNQIAGTEKSDTLIGTDKRDRIDAGGGPDRVDAGAGDDLIIAGGGSADRLIGGTGADIFEFSLAIATNGRKDQTFLLDFDVTEDVIDLGGAQISAVKESRNSVELHLDGGRDRIIVYNTDDFDSITFADPLAIA